MFFNFYFTFSQISGFETTQEELTEVAQISGVFNDDDLDDYIKPETRIRCEQLKIINPEEDSVNIIAPFLYIRDHYED